MAFSKDYFASAKQLTSQLLSTRSLSVSAKIRRMRDAYLSLQANEEWLKGLPSPASIESASMGESLASRNQDNLNRARDLARNQINGSNDHSASVVENADRKNRLVDGPTEFINSRIDQHVGRIRDQD
jgi:hypothetical protein